MGGRSLSRLTFAHQPSVAPPAQELLHGFRQTAASAGLPLRPRLALTAPLLDEHQMVVHENPDMELPADPALEKVEYTPTKTLFLQTEAGTAGVFEVLQACSRLRPSHLLRCCVRAEYW